MAIDPQVLSQDKTFLGMQPEDQRGYLSSQDKDFAGMSSDDQNGYIQHLTGRAPQPPAAPTIAPDAFANMPGAPKNVPITPGQPSVVGGTLNSLASSNYTPTPGIVPRVVGEATEAYHHPLETLKGAAKGVVGVMGNVLPGLQSENVDQTALANNPYVSQRVKDLLHTGTPQAPQDLSGGIVSGIMQPQNTAQQAGSDVANAYAMAEGGRQLLGTLPKLASVGVREGVPGAPALQAKVNPPEANIAPKIYTPEGQAYTASMRSNSHFDMPAEAARAVPRLKEAAADLGVEAKDFQGMNGPAVVKRINAHAIDINEARNVALIDPVRSLPADTSTTPELSELLGKKNPTVGDVDAFRLEANKKLAKSGYYGQSPSQQYAAGPDLAKLETAASQARDTVYDSVLQHTGVDIRPSKQIEASLIKMNDVANSTNNTLAQQEAKFKNAPMTQKLIGTAKMVINPKSLVTNAFEPTLSSPTTEFNRNMQNVFKDVKSAPGSIMKNGRLVEQSKGVLTPPPGQTPPEPGRQLPLNLEPGQHGFNLEPPPGQTPPAPASQYGLPGISRNNLDLHVPPQPTVTPPGPTQLPASPLERMKQLSAGSAPAPAEAPPALREKVPGLDRREPPSTAGEMAYTGSERRNAARDTEGVMNTIKRGKNMPQQPGQINGSSESAASKEALSRAASEKAAGTKRVVVNTLSSQERPLIGPDAVDYRPGPYESVEFRGGKRDGEIIDQGSRARPYKRKK